MLRQYLSLSLSLSILTAIFQMNLGYLVFIEAKDDGGGGDSWSYRSCKAPVKSSPPTNQYQVFSTGWMPFLSPNQQRESTEKYLEIKTILHKASNSWSSKTVF